ncbi:MAG: hypothetical protein R3F20_14830 [Planctomycetota bacterium]
MRTTKIFLVDWEDACELGLVDGETRAEVTARGRRPSWVEIRLDGHDEEARRLLDRLEDNDAWFHLHEERRFSRRELRDAKYLHVDTAFEVECRPGEGSTWDWSGACEHCMRVPEQTGPIAVAPADLESAMAARGRRGEFLVHERVATRMIKDGISGCLLREVLYETESGHEPSPFFQVIPTVSLPTVVSPPTRFASTDAACPHCGRGGLYLESMLYYDIDLGDLADVNVTSELFGEGPSLSPEVVISPRFFNLMVSCGVHFDTSEPVMFV